MPDAVGAGTEPVMPTVDDRSRRAWLVGAAAAWAGWHGATASTQAAGLVAPASALATAPTPRRPRVRPGEAGWPDDAAWQRFAVQIDGACAPVRSVLQDCRSDAAACTALFDAPPNPYRYGDDPGLTQSLGWVDAWRFEPSRYVVTPRSAAHVAAAVHFAREHRLRLVVKGGGHGYQGTSCAPDSLLVWTRALDAIQVHDAFVPAGCDGAVAPTRAVTVGAGTRWAEVYDAVVTQAGGYVQGGGCLTVGVAGLVQSGGFGSFSKAWGLAAGSLLEAEVVTADGQVRRVNACREPDLYWALKGGGGGSFGIVTALTLQVHPLPERFGAVSLTLRSRTPASYRRLVEQVLAFYRDHLMNPHWGEQLRFRPDGTVKVSMVFQGLDRAAARAAWQPLFDALERDGDAFEVESSLLSFVSVPARSFFAPDRLKRWLGFMGHDDRPGAPDGNVFWPGDAHQAGQVIQGYGSCWLGAELLQPARMPALVEAVCEASRHWGVSLHVNKGLAGAPEPVRAQARDTAVHPAAVDAFALAISGAEQGPAHESVPGRAPDVAEARDRRARIARAMWPLRAVSGTAASYVAESDYFEPDWAQAHWGPHHARLAAIKARVDPDDLFVVHHGIGSERWSADGFTPLA